MTYWLNATGYCPVDRGFLEKTGQIRLDVYTCPICGNSYVFCPGTAPISDGFIRPKTVHSCGPKKEAFQPGLILSMTVPPKAV